MRAVRIIGIALAILATVTLCAGARRPNMSSNAKALGGEMSDVALLQGRHATGTRLPKTQRYEKKGKTPLAIAKRRAEYSPIKLAPTSKPRSFSLRASESTVIIRVLQAFGIQATIGPGVTDRVVLFDITGADFANTVKALQLATDTFIVPLSPKRALVVANTPKDNRKYGQWDMKTFHLPGLTKKELGQLESVARYVVGISDIVLSPSERTITARAPPSKLVALSKVYDELLSCQREVQLSIHVYEIDRSKEVNAGAIMPNSATLFNVRAEANNVLANNEALVEEIISSGEASSGDWQKIIAILIASGALSGTVFNNPFVIFGGGLTEMGAEWNTTAANMLLNSANIKSVTEMHLLVHDRTRADFFDGERYPIITGTYSNIGAGAGAPSGGSPQIQYANLGVDLKVTPSIGMSQDVTLTLKLQLRALTGAVLNNIPILSNRQYSGVVSLRRDESALLVSDISKEQLQNATGIPGMSNIPALGAGTDRHRSSEVVELVILVTPHIVRSFKEHGAGSVVPLGTE